MRNPFRYFKTSPGIIRLAVMVCVRFPLSLRNVENLLHERGIDITHETVRFWWNRFGPMQSLQKFAAVQSSIHNQFNLERHFYRREEFKENRSAALAEWRQLAA
ncbi:hypothetical protein [Maricaulis sp.]|uniref:hypothetical protein n=1 Tax=Maricaulis sp. TaxID=1486257 RepID=UPI00344BC76A